jgi:methyl-accepting chemotaxis protein
VVEQVIDKIHHLAEQVEQAAQTINKLEQDSEGINSILDVITTISEQTNLLALNAAIEAARAGEQGRGFAVVADEVRTLASRTQSSASEINQMIERLQDGSRQAVAVMNTSCAEAREAVEYAANAGASLQTIADVVRKINDMNTQIASAAEQQSAVVDDITRKIVAISDRATENVTGAQQTAAAGQALSELAANLRGTVNGFRT